MPGRRGAVGAAAEGGYDFDALARECPETVGPVLKVDAKGRRYVDLRTREGLVAVTTAALKAQHGVEWSLPDGHLCPPVPNRTHYVRWIHSLLKADRDAAHPDGRGGAGCRGIDVGTGASLIYPLLSSALYGWQMVGSDTDGASLGHAAGLVARNGLEGKVELVEVPGDTVVAEVVREMGRGEGFDFMMCNPPFFEAEEEPQAGGKRRQEDPAPSSSTKRRRLKAAGYVGDITRSENECEGGELAFARQLLEESYDLPKDAVRWFTLMFGRKASIKQFIKALTARPPGSLTYRSTEFTLGHTTRWLVAWRVLEPHPPPSSPDSCPSPVGSFPPTPEHGPLSDA